MVDRPRIVAFDVDADSLASLREAFPEGAIEAVQGATTASLRRDWDPGVTDLLVVGAGDSLGSTLGLCRGVRSQAGRAHTPLLVLMRPTQQALVQAALAAGADGCLVLPVHPKELVRVLAQAREGNRPGRHTLSLSRAQREDPWQDDGGEA
jgi:DNA-binding response OmpR family regulator